MQSLLQDPEYAVRSSCCMVSMCRGCGHCHCTVWVLQSLVAPCGVLWSQLLHRVGCCGHCTVCSVTVVALHGVSQPLCHVQCRSCGVVVAAIVLCVMLWLWKEEDGHVSIGKGGGRWEVGECCA